jgi:protein-S-isoprenylcysteine O-methyltransferase Ste14
MTTPLPFSWPYALLFWPVYIWVFIPELRLARRTRITSPAPVEDRGSARVLLLGFGFSSTAAFLLAFFAPAATLWRFRPVFFSLGVIALLAGSLLRRACFRELGRFFTGVVTIQPEHRLVDTGPYRWVRHPSYSAGLLILLGIGLSLTNWLSIAVCVVVGFAAYTYRARVEEQALLVALGDPYARFMESRKRFVPFVY